MKKAVLIFLCAASLMLCASCGASPQTTDGTTLSAAADAEPVLPADLSAVTAAETMDDADVTCVPLERDGKTIGFEMRFLQSVRLDKLFSDQENMYFAVADCGKKPIGIPMEQIRILTDSETHEFVLTILLPSGEKLSGKTCTVAFYTAKRDMQSGNALFCARKDVSLP